MTSMQGPGGRHPVVAPVSLSAWQIECCVPPPGVGDDVAWPLSWVSTGPDGADEDGLDHVGAHRRTWLLRRRDDDVLLVDGALVAGCSGAGLAHRTGLVALTGELVAVLHGGGHPPGLPTVHGWVRQVWVTSQLFVPRRSLDGPRWGCWAPVAGTGAARKVAHSPHRFAGGLARAQPDAARRAETGVLIDLAVDPGRGRGQGGEGISPGWRASVTSEALRVGHDAPTGLDHPGFGDPEQRRVDPLDTDPARDELADPWNVIRPGDPCPQLRTAHDIRCPARWFDARQLRAGTADGPWWCLRAAGHPGQHIAGVPGSHVAAVTGVTRLLAE